MTVRIRKVFEWFVERANQPKILTALIIETPWTHDELPRVGDEIIINSICDKVKKRLFHSCEGNLEIIIYLSKQTGRLYPGFFELLKTNGWNTVLEPIKEN